MFHQPQPEEHLGVYIQVGLQRGEDAVTLQGKSPSYLFLILSTRVCSVNSVPGEDCAYSQKCSYPVGIIPSQERQSFTMGCEAAGELIL